MGIFDTLRAAQRQQPRQPWDERTPDGRLIMNIGLPEWEQRMIAEVEAKYGQQQQPTLGGPDMPTSAGPRDMMFRFGRDDQSIPNPALAEQPVPAMDAPPARPRFVQPPPQPAPTNVMGDREIPQRPLIPTLPVPGEQPAVPTPAPTPAPAPGVFAVSPTPEQPIDFRGDDAAPLGRSRPRLANPAEHIRTGIEAKMAEPLVDGNGGLKSTLLGALFGGLQGLSGGDIGKGIGGAIGGAAGGGIDHTFDERMKRDFQVGQDQQKLGIYDSAAEGRLKRRLQEAQIGKIEGEPARQDRDRIVGIYKNLPEFDPNSKDPNVQALVARANALGISLPPKSKGANWQLVERNGESYWVNPRTLEERPATLPTQRRMVPDEEGVLPGTRATARATEGRYNQSRADRIADQDYQRTRDADERAAKDADRQRGSYERTRDDANAIAGRFETAKRDWLEARQNGDEAAANGARNAMMGFAKQLQSYNEHYKVEVDEEGTPALTALPMKQFEPKRSAAPPQAGGTAKSTSGRVKGRVSIDAAMKQNPGLKTREEAAEAIRAAKYEPY